MLNLADLGAILIILINPIVGAVCSATGSWTKMLAATAVGLLVGLSAAFCSGKLSYWFLGREDDARGLIAGLTFMGYMLTPMLFLGGSMLASVWLARCILSIAP